MSGKRLVRWGIYLGTAGLVGLGALIAGTAAADTSPGTTGPAVVVDQYTDPTPIPEVSTDKDTYWG